MNLSIPFHPIVDGITSKSLFQRIYSSTLKTQTFKLNLIHLCLVKVDDQSLNQLPSIIRCWTKSLGNARKLGQGKKKSKKQKQRGFLIGLRKTFINISSIV